MQITTLFDELNILKSRIENAEIYGKAMKEEIEDFLIEAYMDGVFDAGEALGSQADNITMQMVDEAIFKQVGGKTYEQRIDEYIITGDISGVFNVLDTETRRDYGAGGYDAAKAVSGAIPIYKKWITQKDDKVRDTHYYLEGVRVPLDDKFYTYDGDSALYPGDFLNAENNCNCRCYIKYES